MFARHLDDAVDLLISIPLGIRKAVMDGRASNPWTFGRGHHSSFSIP